MVLYKILLTSVLIISTAGLSKIKAETNSIFSAVIQVDNTVVTEFELDQRIKFLSALKFPGNPNQLARMQLIEERLKQIESEKLNIILSDVETEDAQERFASRANLSAKEFIEELKRLGIYSQTFKSYIETEVLWQKVLEKKFGAHFNISKLQLKRSKNTAKYEDTVQVLLTEIIIPVSSQDIREKENIASLLQNIKDINEFSKAARKYSKAPTASVGGQVKWQSFNTLPEIIKPVIFGLSPGEVSEPIRLPKAIALFQLRDIREHREEKVEAELLDFITVRSNFSKLKTLENIQDNFQNCSDLPAIIGDQIGFTLIRSKQFSYELPENIATVLGNLDSNEAKIIIDDEKSQLVILCERNYQKKSTVEKIESDTKILKNKRLKYLARSLLETLKDDARIVIK